MYTVIEGMGGIKSQFYLSPFSGNYLFRVLLIVIEKYYNM